MKYGDYITLSKPVAPEDVPSLFRKIYMPLIAGIKRKGGTPDLKTIRIIINNDFKEPTFGITVDALFGGRNFFEEVNNEWTTGREGGGEEDRGDERDPGV